MPLLHLPATVNVRVKVAEDLDLRIMSEEVADLADGQVSIEVCRTVAFRTNLGEETIIDLCGHHPQELSAVGTNIEEEIGVLIGTMAADVVDHDRRMGEAIDIEAEALEGAIWMTKRISRSRGETLETFPRYKLSSSMR